jgi:hypothetical protein
MTTIDAVNAILKTIGRKPARKTNKPAKKTCKMSGKAVFVKLTKPKKDKSEAITIRRSFREILQ